LRARAEHPSLLVREHVAWALAQRQVNATDITSAKPNAGDIQEAAPAD
jgi:hypothetical protein